MNGYKNFTMKNIIKNTTEWLDHLITSPVSELNRWLRPVKFQVQLCRFSWRRLRELNAQAMAAALSFRTLFAMIPLLVLSLMIMSAMGIVEDSKHSLRSFLDSSGIGQITVTSDGKISEDTTTESDTDNSLPQVIVENKSETDTVTPEDETVRQYNVADEIEKIVTRIQSKMTTNAVGAIGVIIMISAALALLVDVEKSLNRIFEARRHRAIGKRMLLYWSVVTLLPIVQSAAVLIGSKTQAYLLTNAVVGRYFAHFTGIIPIIGSIIMVALVYRLMPNTRTKFRWALFGAILVVPIWFITKFLFGLYVSKLVGPNNLYGTIGLLPLMLLWINTSWVMFLYGAVIAHIAANISVMESSEMAASINLGPLDILAATMAIAGPFSRGEGPVSMKQLRSSLHLPDDCIQSLIDRLIERQVICPVEDPMEVEASWLPARPLESIDLLDVTGLNPDNAIVLRDVSDPILKKELEQICEITRQSLAELSLADATRIAND